MNEPTLRIVIGTAGSGKSTIARRLARQYAAAYLDKDAMSARFVEAALLAAGYDPGDRESNAFYRERISPSSTTRSLTSLGPTSASATRRSSTHRSARTRRSHLHHRGPRSASTGPRSTSRWSASACPLRLCRIGYGNAASSATGSSRPLGRVLGRARGTTLRLDRRSAIRILQRRT